MRSTLLSLFLLALVTASAVANVPRTISFQGRARDASGAYPDNVRQVTVRIYDDESSGNVLFSETHTVKFNRGSFTVLIGDQSGGIPDDLEFNQQLWLEISISGFNNDLPLSPRLRFGSAPSAMNAQTAGLALGLAAGATVNVSSLAPSDTAGSSATPDAGGLYRDNVPMAWALIDSDGTILADFGIERVVRGNRGQYTIVLDNPAVFASTAKGRVPAVAPIVQPSALTDVGSPLTAQWFFAGTGVPDADRTVYVRTYAAPNGTPIANDVPFSIVIFGRPAH